MSTTLVERLREGVIEHRRRWSGDTHDDLGGSVDYEATEALMHEAADYIAAQSRTIELLGNDLDSARVVIERLESQLAGLAKPAYHQPPYLDGYFGEL